MNVVRATSPGLRLAGEFWSDAPLGGALVVVAADAGPIESPLAHRARRGGRVDFTIGKVALVEPSGGIANRKKLGVGGGIALKHHVISAFAHDDAIAHDNGAVGLIAF
jgi:hypothetical protein